MNRILALVCLSAAFLFGQSGEGKPTFEVADIRLSPKSVNPFFPGAFVRGGRYELRHATMVDMISTAYGIKADNVFGGPAWLEDITFDVVAKAPGAAKPEPFKPHLQALLADRFKLVVHDDKKPMPAFALTAPGKHPQLKKSEDAEEQPASCKFSVPGMTPGTPPPPDFQPMIVYVCRNMTMKGFADEIPNMPFADQATKGNQVVDKTEVEGAWDFTFKYSLRGRPGAAQSENITFMDALDKQLGLKLESTKVPLPVLVVDSVNEKPTANLPDSAERLNLSTIPTEFEVATIKPTNPDFKGLRLQIQPGGRVNIAGVTLSFLMQQIWNITPEMIVGAPKWLDQDRWDIVARAPRSAVITLARQASGFADQPPPDIHFDDALAMVKKLLADRFQLKVHEESKTLPAYTLSAGKPKMKKSEPGTRTKFREGPALDSKNDPRDKTPILGRLVTCQNMTMAQFAAKLQSIAPGYIKSPVLDATSLEGSYDFTISFSPAGAVGRGGAGGGGRDGGGPPAAAPPAGGDINASDPNGAMTLFEAIDRQLGLKLEQTKRPIAVLVIDNVLQKPTEN